MFESIRLDPEVISLFSLYVMFDIFLSWEDWKAVYVYFKTPEEFLEWNQYAEADQ